jgi:hypothetical protein
MPKRNRVASFLLMPFAVFLWCIGWGLYFVGSKRGATKLRSKFEVSVEKELIMFVPIPEQKYAT